MAIVNGMWALGPNNPGILKYIIWCKWNQKAKLLLLESCFKTNIIELKQILIWILDDQITPH